MRPLNERGQYIPITAMVMFTTMVFLVAVVNIYKVTKEKLKVQNLADAVALNIASQMASSMNKVSDLNEWMNHFTAPSGNGQPTKPGDIPNCAGINPNLPPLSCAENMTKNKNLNMFSLKGDAANYAALVNTINKTQQLFVAAYNNFIGAGVGSNSSAMSNSSLNSILYSDIPELRDPGTSVVVWNDQGGMSRPQTNTTAPASRSGLPPSSLDTTGMQPLRFKVHDVTVTYKTVIPVLNAPGPDVTTTLGQLLSGGSKTFAPVGWLEPDVNLPAIKVGGQQGASKFRVGAGAKVTRIVQVPLLGNYRISAQSQAYVVEGSGTMGAQSELKSDPMTGVKRPVFKPTYWVKLAGAK